MASIEKRGNSYRIKVSCGYKVDGKQVTQRMTWTPDPDMTPKQIEKELQRQVVLFEEECKHGQIVSAVKFEGFAEEWFEDYAKLNLKSTTYTRQRQLTKRVYKAIGHLRLDKITTREIQKFINSLAKEGVNEHTGKPLSRKTMVHYLSFISTILDYAIRMDMLNELKEEYREEAHREQARVDKAQETALKYTTRITSEELRESSEIKRAGTASASAKKPDGYKIPVFGDTPFSFEQVATYISSGVVTPVTEFEVNGEIMVAADISELYPLLVKFHSVDCPVCGNKGLKGTFCPECGSEL